MAALAELNQKIEQLSAANEQLSQNQVTQNQVKEAKITLPDKFDGSRATYRGFVNQLKLVFLMAPNRYATDAVKIATVGSLLKGDALAWYNPFIEWPDKHKAALASWKEFLTVMNSAFSDPDLEAVAEAKIRNLKQGRGAASAYVSRFKQIASDLSWNDAALISQFRAGLSEAVKDMLVYQDPLPTGLEEFHNLAIRLDNRIFERDQDKRRAGPKLSNPLPSNTPSPTVPVPMDIDAVTSRRRGPLSQEERARRFEQGLCMYCGQPGHRAYNCVNRRSQVAAVSTTDGAGAQQDFHQG